MKKSVRNWSVWYGVGTAAVTLVGPISYFTRSSDWTSNQDVTSDYPIGAVDGKIGE